MIRYIIYPNNIYINKNYMLTELIIEICECERRTEIVRKVLATLTEFEPYAGIFSNNQSLQKIG